MKRVLLFLLVPALVAAFTLTSDTTYSAPPAKVQPTYQALGASITFGIGATELEGYVPLFRDFLESKDGLRTDLSLNNLSVPGATSGDIKAGQLPVSLAQLEELNSDKKKQNDVKVITVASGGNDLLQFLGSEQLALCFLPDLTQCFDALGGVLDTFEANFELTLDALRNAAGPNTTIIAMTFYNPLLRTGCDPTFGLLASLGNGALEGVPGTSIEDGLNDIIRSAAAKHDVDVADTFLPFAADPDALVSGDCVHPNDAGHAVITDIFIETFEG